ncbi:hypothetical protein CLOM_g1747, partial [Closterium sp. NIES-68]
LLCIRVGFGAAISRIPPISSSRTPSLLPLLLLETSGTIKPLYQTDVEHLLLVGDRLTDLWLRLSRYLL